MDLFVVREGAATLRTMVSVLDCCTNEVAQLRKLTVHTVNVGMARPRGDLELNPTRIVVQLNALIPAHFSHHNPNRAELATCGNSMGGMGVSNGAHADIVNV